MEESAEDWFGRHETDHIMAEVCESNPHLRLLLVDRVEANKLTPEFFKKAIVYSGKSDNRLESNPLFHLLVLKVDKELRVFRKVSYEPNLIVLNDIYRDLNLTHIYGLPVVYSKAPQDFVFFP